MLGNVNNKYMQGRGAVGVRGVIYYILEKNYVRSGEGNYDIQIITHFLEIHFKCNRGQFVIYKT